MEFTARRSGQIVAALLFAVVAPQLIYFALSSAGLDINRTIIWTAEAAAFLGISVFALIPMAHQPRFGVAWAAVAVGGVLNVIQVGMGLAMFPPLTEAGEVMAPAFSAILAGAFFLYFAGKFLFAAAAIAIGTALFGGGGGYGGGGGKIVGAPAVLTGLAALAVNLYAMGVGMDAVFPAGATGTAATFFLAVALIAANRKHHGPTIA